MVKQQIKRQNSGLHMEAVTRFGNIPIIETGFKAAEDAYTRIKSSNRLFNWYLDTAEAALLATVESFLPAIRLFEGPLRRIDKIMCKSLDLVEQRVPAVYLPPQMMYWNTKEYMSDRLVKPVLKRADSVKQLGSAVLELPITEFAADRIDGAITVADKYVDKYLPVEGNADQVDGNLGSEPNEKDKAAIKAIYHGTRFSRKLKRRLTARTILEARALKKQGKEAIHVLLYAAELIVKDPKQALQKARELWAYLSADEPENQARPQTLEQLLVLLTRESARRVVHLLNYTTAVAASIPRNPFRRRLHFRKNRAKKTTSNHISDIAHATNGNCNCIRESHQPSSKKHSANSSKTNMGQVHNNSGEVTDESNPELEFDIRSEEDFPSLRKGSPISFRAWSGPSFSAITKDIVAYSIDEGLFSKDELIALSTELVNRLAQCTTKTDQYKVLVALAAEFLYCNRNVN